MKVDVDFEKIFARMVDVATAPGNIRWMAQKKTFTSKEYFIEYLGYKGKARVRRGTMKWFMERKFIKVIYQSKGGNHKDETIYEWIGPL